MIYFPGKEAEKGTGRSAVSQYSHGDKHGKIIQQISGPPFEQHDEEKYAQENQDHHRVQTLCFRFFFLSEGGRDDQNSMKQNSGQYEKPQTLSPGGK